MENDNVRIILFGADVVQNATTLADLDVGEIAVFGDGGTLLSPAAISALGPHEKFQYVMGTAAGSAHKFSPRMTKSGIRAHRGTSFAAAVEQVSFIGDNGTTGDINVSNDTEYAVNVSFYHNTDIYAKRHDKRRFTFQSGAAATAAGIQNGLIAKMNGDERFAGLALAAIEVGGGNNGISITGLAQTDTDFDNPEYVRFKIGLDGGFDDTTGVDAFGEIFVNGASSPTNSNSILGTKGVGTARKIKALERNGQALLGHSNQRLFPIPGFPEFASTTGTYDVYIIDFIDSHANGAWANSQQREFPQQLMIVNNILTTVNASTAAIEALNLAVTSTAVNL